MLGRQQADVCPHLVAGQDVDLPALVQIVHFDPKSVRVGVALCGEVGDVDRAPRLAALLHGKNIHLYELIRILYSVLGGTTLMTEQVIQTSACCDTGASLGRCGGRKRA